MKAELKAPGPFRGVVLTAETEEEVLFLVNLFMGKARVVSLYNPRKDRKRVANVVIAPTEEE